MSMAGGPEPPNMHWFLILALSFFTGGLAGFVWLLRESLFVKKIDAASKAVVYWVVLLVAMVVQVILYFKALSPDSASGAVMASSLIMLLNLVIMVIALVMVFSMRKSIVTYYNTAEPIGLKLSGVMTFFFSILYFQYHFSRIIRWKKTGVLS